VAWPVGKHKVTVLREDLGRHPAVEAWRRLDSRPGRPTSIEVLKPEKRKSAVFRLNGIGPSGQPVVAKRRPKGDSDVELRLYAELLPTLSIPALELYGFISDDDYSWLFLEDAGEVWYAPDTPEHRELAVTWLADLHTEAATFLDWFPHTGTEYFRAQIHAGRDGVRNSLTHPSVSPSDGEILRAILSHLDAVEERWDDIEAACAGMPNTLVHSDFVPKNVRVRSTRNGRELLTFDWETGGWATPAADIALLPGDADARREYHRRVAASWPSIVQEDIDRLYSVGTLFRLIHSVHWETRSFRYVWIQRAMRNMTLYDRYLRSAIREDGWLV
jgi:hypothetical protein